MQFHFPVLSGISIDERGYASLDQRKEDELVAPIGEGLFEGRRWSVDSIPRSDRWVERPTAELLPFSRIAENNSATEDSLAGYEQYRQFQVETQCINHISAFTGQLANAYGDLWPGQPGNSDEHAQEFLSTYQLLWAGRSGDVGQRRVRRSTWRDGTVSLDFHQVNAQNIPVLGGRIVLTYDSDQRLAIVNSSLFPMTTEELPRFDDAPPDQEGLELAVRDYLKTMDARIEFATLVDVQFTQSDEFGFVEARRPYELWVLPFFREPDRGEYLAAFRTFFLDAQQQYWALWLDASVRAPLFLERRESHNAVLYDVYPRPRDAIDGRKRPRQLDLGGNAETLSAAVQVKVSGDRFYDPRTPTMMIAPQITGAQDPRHILAANTYHHLWQIQYDFVDRMNAVLADQEADQEDGQQVNSRSLPTPINEIAASLEATAGSGRFSWETGQILLHGGVAGFPPVLEPAFDGDVITHEYVHAVLHYYYRPLFENTNVLPELGTAFDALDEALAFYYACVHFNDARWGEFAYAGFGNRNFVDPIAPFQEVWQTANGPAGSNYVYALWWAHILWRLHLDPALQPVLPSLLLQVLRQLTETPPSTDDLTGASSNRLFSIFNRIADQIYLRSQLGGERAAVEAVWADAGFALPA